MGKGLGLRVWSLISTAASGNDQLAVSLVKGLGLRMWCLISTAVSENDPFTVSLVWTEGRFGFLVVYRGTPLNRKHLFLGLYSRPEPRALWRV